MNTSKIKTKTHYVILLSTLLNFMANSSSACSCNCLFFLSSSNFKLSFAAHASCWSSLASSKVIGAEALPSAFVLENGSQLDIGTDCRPSIVIDGTVEGLYSFVIVSSFLSSNGAPKGSSKRLKGSSKR